MRFLSFCFIVAQLLSICCVIGLYHALLLSVHESTVLVSYCQWQFHVGAWGRNRPLQIMASPTHPNLASPQIVARTQI